MFRKKTKPPLLEAIEKVHAAIEIAYAYKRDSRYRPSETDLTLLTLLTHRLWQGHATAEYITRKLHERVTGSQDQP